MRLSENIKFSENKTEGLSKIKTSGFTQFIGQQRFALVAYLMSGNYSEDDKEKEIDKCDFPNLRDMMSLLESKGNIPEALKRDRINFFFLGQNLDGQDSKNTFWLTWNGRELIYNTGSLAGEWGTRDAVVAIPK